MGAEADDVKIVQKNRKAFYDFEILEKYEAGMVLRGSEVKSIREGHVSIHEAHARVKGEEVWVINLDISTYKNAGPLNHEPKRARKLLLKKREIQKIAGKLSQRGLTLIPLSLYFKNGLAKLEIGLAQPKKKWDKRETIKKRESDRELRKRPYRR